MKRMKRGQKRRARTEKEKKKEDINTHQLRVIYEAETDAIFALVCMTAPVTYST